MLLEWFQEYFTQRITVYGTVLREKNFCSVRGPLSLVNTIEELLGRKSSSSGLEIQEYGRRVPSR
jgi:hypothetical protein